MENPIELSQKINEIIKDLDYKTTDLAFNRLRDINENFEEWFQDHGAGTFMCNDH